MLIPVSHTQDLLGVYCTGKCILGNSLNILHTFFFHPTETLPSHYFKTTLSSAVPVSCLHTRGLSSPTSSFPPSPTAHTYLLQLLSPGVCFWWIGVFSNQFPQRALHLLHLSWVLGQFWQQGLQKRNNVCISKLFNKANKTWLWQTTDDFAAFLPKKKRHHKAFVYPLPCSPGPELVPPPVWRERRSVPASGFPLCLSASS